MKTLPTLRRALEDAELKDEPVVIKGPLSDAFTQSLNEIYTKQKESGDNISTESQANDAYAMQSLARAISDAVDGPDELAPVVYAVDAAAVTDNDVIDLTKDLITQDQASDASYALILDTTSAEVQTGTGGDGIKFVDTSPTGLAKAMEQIALHHGVKIYPSLEAYATARYVR